MRDLHWEQCHQVGQEMNWLPQNPDEDEIQPLLFDLVRADKVELVKGLCRQFQKCAREVKDSLVKLAVSSGSPAMVDLLLKYHNSLAHEALVVAAVRGNNMETFRHLLPNSRCMDYSVVLPEILKSKSEEFLLNWEIYIDTEHETWIIDKRHVSFYEIYIGPRFLSVAKGDPDNERLILLLWEKLNLAKVGTKAELGDTLVHVAAKCGSMKLAKYLIDAGVSVDYRRSSKYLTPLHHAVKHNTLEAAKLVKFLLGMGADPEAFAVSRHGKITRIKDEAGVRGISKWLGVSWDNLVEQTKAEREKSNRREENAKPAS